MHPQETHERGGGDQQSSNLQTIIGEQMTPGPPLALIYKRFCVERKLDCQTLQK